MKKLFVLLLLLMSTVVFSETLGRIDYRNGVFTGTLKENKKVAKRGGNVAKVAKETLEQETGKPVITTKNAIDFGRLISDVTKEIPN